MLLSGLELKSLVTQEQEYISSRAGQNCLKELGVAAEKEQFIKTIEAAVKTLSYFEFGNYAELGFHIEAIENPIPKLQFKNFKNISLEYVGCGHFGMVYKIANTSGQAYALKIFYPRDADYNASGPWSETALAIYTTKQKVSNLPHLCLANPQNDWLLCEYVDVNFKSTTPEGPKLNSLGLINLDSFNDGQNQIQTSAGEIIRFDFGHLGNGHREQAEYNPLLDVLKKEYSTNTFANLDTFTSLAKEHPEARAQLSRKLFCIKPEERLNALRSLLTYPECHKFPLHDYIDCGIFSQKIESHCLNFFLKNKIQNF